MKEKLCYVGRGNCQELVRDNLISRGWASLPIEFNCSHEYKLKWVQTPSEIDFPKHIEGLQLVNHIPNINRALCCKKALVEALRCVNIPIPLSYDLSDMSDRRKFIEAVSDGIWISKPLAENQGKGIKMIFDVNKFKNSILTNEERYDIIVQKYVINPLLINGYKFDMRMFALLTYSKRWVLLSYPLFYGRKSLNLYQTFSSDKLTHLTNASQQKKHPEYNSRKSESIIPMEEIIELVGESNFRNMQIHVHNALISLFLAKKSEIIGKNGCFQLLGLDVLLDDNLQPHLLEVNINPALFTDTEPQKRLFPTLINDVLTVVLGLHEEKTEYLEGTQFSVLYQE